jgi:hypothetical protein
MANWMNAGRNSHDNALVLYKVLSGFFLGIWGAALLGRRWPSVDYWLIGVGCLFTFVFVMLAGFRSKKLNQNSAGVRSN